MNVPVWVLLGFAAWTLLVLMSTVGVYRWRRILTGRAELKEFPADSVHGSELYRRAMRAHANCVENLPIYAAVVVAIEAAEVTVPSLNSLATVLLAARICQTLVHVASGGNLATGVRFGFFVVQVGCMFAMGAIVAASA